MTTHRIAGAPITWGVCEVPGWGRQLPPDRVLSELAGIGLDATELGPDGFLPVEPEAVKELLASHGLGLVAGFVPAVLHRPDGLTDRLAEVERQARTLATAGAEVLVLAAAADGEGYEHRADLSDDAWKVLTEAIIEVEATAADLGLVTAVHPHYGTVIETSDHVHRLLDLSDVGVCVDTGHLLVGGVDPVAITAMAAHRVRHVHLKDVDARLAARVRAGEVGYHDAVAAGLYRVLGDGDVDIPAILHHLETSGYDGWYVLEQDTVIQDDADDADPAADARASLAYLRHALSTLTDRGRP